MDCKIGDIVYDKNENCYVIESVNESTYSVYPINKNEDTIERLYALQGFKVNSSRYLENLVQLYCDPTMITTIKEKDIYIVAGSVPESEIGVVRKTVLKSVNTWMIMVNPVCYNLFGAVREFCGKERGNLWFTDNDIKEVNVDDIVYFYLTSGDSKVKYEMSKKISDCYKRVVFKGVVKDINLDKELCHWDDKYWDKEQMEQQKSKYNKLVEILITDFIYDKHITSKEITRVCHSTIWTKNRETFIVPINADFEQKCIMALKS